MQESCALNTFIFPFEMNDFKRQEISIWDFRDLKSLCVFPSLINPSTLKMNQQFSFLDDSKEFHLKPRDLDEDLSSRQSRYLKIDTNQDDGILNM